VPRKAEVPESEKESTGAGHVPKALCDILGQSSLLRGIGAKCCRPEWLSPGPGLCSADAGCLL
jgi:hypothetical protein